MQVRDRGICAQHMAQAQCNNFASFYAVIDLYEKHCIDAAYLYSDANTIYNDACHLLDVPHYIRAPNYNTVLDHAGCLYPESGKVPEERKAYNKALLERLY